ncbi:MAG: PIN domain-containing protein [Planctomycetes bacterium]|nr:PIN domain-containing protein [Planctomycetota bacterium]
MIRVVPDTSCLVAAVASWHEHHEATWKEFERCHRQGDLILIAGHTLLEAYAVLTGLPAPHRISPAQAFALLKGNWGANQVASIDEKGYWRLLEQGSVDGICGGSIYDANIAAIAKKAKANVLLTWNKDHFIRFANANFKILFPGECR